MGRLIRVSLGMVVLVVGLALGLRFSEQAYLSLVGTNATITIVGDVAPPCEQPRVLVLDRAPRCNAVWEAAATQRGSGHVIGVSGSNGETFQGKVFMGTAVVPLDGSDRSLGLFAPVLVLAGLAIALGGRRRRRRANPRTSYARRTSRSRGDGYYDSGDGDAYGDDHGHHDGGGGGYDGGGDSGGGGDGGGGGD
jgi:hypothetical protein